MKIPAKTFLLGEYAALQGESALLLTTKPFFTLQLTDKGGHPFHPDSPAGRFIGSKPFSCTFTDPFHGLGGMGASSAEFLACYHASGGDETSLLPTYYACAASPSGLKPSGYDVLAQSRRGCVFINKNRNQIEIWDWPFKNLSFLLIHTKKKLQTHTHLQKTSMPDIRLLSALADQGRLAFEQADDDLLVRTVNDCHAELLRHDLVAQHTQQFIAQFKNHPHILALKGCGALGSDTILLLMATEHVDAMKLLLSEYYLLAEVGDLS